MSDEKLHTTFGSINISIGQADNDLAPEALVRVTVGGADVFTQVLDPIDLAKVLPLITGLMSALSRFIPKG